MSNEEARIKVTFILPSLVFGGGIEKHLIKMLAVADHTRFAYSLVTLFEYPERPDLYAEVPPGVRVRRLGSKGIKHLATWSKAYRALKELAPDVVITSMFSPNALARILKPFFGYSVITREHNPYDEKRLYHRILDHLLSYLSDRIVAVSCGVADFTSAQEWIPRSRFTVIENGVDIDVINAFLGHKESEVHRVRMELGFHDDERIILNIARLKPTKDHPLLLRAFKIFIQDHPHHHLVIVSDGSDRPMLEKLLKELGLSARVHLLGYRRDAYAWFAASEMFVLSSKREGFPNVGVEAIAFGLPFITTPVAGAEEIVDNGRNGVIARPDPASIADAMRLMADIPAAESSEMSSQCRESARRFDIRTVTRRYEDLIETVCRR